MNPTVIVADDHPILLTGTKAFLESKRFNILTTALDGNEAYNAIVNHSPDIAILDFDMPKLNGLEIALQCQQKGFKTKIIILTLYKQEAILNEVGKTTHGYLLKEDALQEIEFCINEVLAGKTFVSKHITEGIHFSKESNAGVFFSGGAGVLATSGEVQDLTQQSSAIYPMDVHAGMGYEIGGGIMFGKVVSLSADYMGADTFGVIKLGLKVGL